METLGQKRIRTQFNPSQTSIVDQIKQKSAELIDLVQCIKSDEVVKPENQERLTPDSQEIIRLVSLSQTAIEEASMWGVKAATYYK